jgi:hypothetical protein
VRSTGRLLQKSNPPCQARSFLESCSALYGLTYGHALLACNTDSEKQASAFGSASMQCSHGTSAAAMSLAPPPAPAPPATH